MGRALAEAAITAGHQVVVVSGPVEVEYPAAARVLPVVSTEQMLEASLEVFPDCDGLIAVAAPCDYRPLKVSSGKIRRTGEPLHLHLVETPDIVALLAAVKHSQWMVAFALETEDERFRAMQKLERKRCDLIVVNGPAAIGAGETSVEVLDRSGRVVGAFAGQKRRVAREVFQLIERLLIAGRSQANSASGGPVSAKTGPSCKSNCRALKKSGDAGR